jgi:hypothetical protein
MMMPNNAGSREYDFGGGFEQHRYGIISWIGDLVARYRISDEFKRLSEGTQTNNAVHMRRFEAHDTWGVVRARDLSPLAAQTARDAMKDIPVTANQMLSVAVRYGIGPSRLNSPRPTPSTR